MNRLLILPLLLTACADPVSNEIFESDLVFLDALPSKARHVIDTEPDTAELPRGERLDSSSPFMLLLTVGAAETFNVWVLELLSVVDLVRSLPPSERSLSHRAWGPFEYPEQPGFYIKVVMSREGRGTYDWSFLISEGAEGEGAPFFWGSHYAGESVAAGDGSFVWDYDVLAEKLGSPWGGRLVVDYDHREGKELLVDIDEIRGEAGEQPMDGTYWYSFNGSLGDFEYRTEADIGDDGSEEELLEARVRWLAGGLGRGDGTITGGDLGTLVYEVTQCWDAEGELTYQGDNIGSEETGSQSSGCPYQDFAPLEHIP